MSFKLENNFNMYYLYWGLGLFTRNTVESGTKCKKCGSELHSSERLKRHQKLAHDKKNDKCRICGKEFPDPEDLRRHKKQSRWFMDYR